MAKINKWNFKNNKVHELKKKKNPTAFVLAPPTFPSRSDFQYLPCVFLGIPWTVLRKQACILTAGAGWSDVARVMLTAGLKTTFCKNSTEVKFCSMNFPTAKSPPQECLVLHLSTRTRECVYTLAHVHIHTFHSCFQQKLRGEKKDLVLSKLSQFPHLPVWVNLTRMISFVFSLLYGFFFSLPNPEIPWEVFFKSAPWQVYTCRPQPGSKRYNR